MNIKDKYQLALEAMKEASTVYKDIESEQLYGETLIDLARYSSLLGNEKTAMEYIREAIDTDKNSAILFLNDVDFINCREKIKQEIEERTTRNRYSCELIMVRLDGLYIPEKYQDHFNEELHEIETLLNKNTFFDSELALEMMKELETYSNDLGLISKDEHREKQRLKKIKEEEERRLEEQRIREAEAQAIKEEEERQIALEKAEKEKRAREKKKAKEKAEQARIAREKEEEELRKQRIYEEKIALEKRKKLIFTVAIIVISIALIFILINRIQNRTRSESMDVETLDERLTQPYGKFISYFFVYNDSEVIEIQALPGRKIKTPDNSDRNKDYLVSNWSTDFSIKEKFPAIQIPESYYLDDENVVSALPGEEIQMGTTRKIFFADLEPVPHRIRFDGNGIKGFEREFELPYSSQYEIPEFFGPIPKDLEFLGWSSSKTGDPQKAYLPGETIIMPANDITMYALWKPKDGVSISPILYVLTAPGQFILIFVTILITSNIILVRIIMIIIGLLVLGISLALYDNDHKFWGTIFLYIALTTIFWGFLPHMKLMMTIVNLW